MYITPVAETSIISTSGYRVCKGVARLVVQAQDLGQPQYVVLEGAETASDTLVMRLRYNERIAGAGATYRPGTYATAAG